MVVGLGLVAALGYAVKEYALPKVTQWYKDWRNNSDKESAEQETQKTAQLVASAIQAQVCSSLSCFFQSANLAPLAVVYEVES